MPRSPMPGSVTGWKSTPSTERRMSAPGAFEDDMALTYSASDASLAVWHTTMLR